MPPRLLGDPPLASDANGTLASRIGTVFPADNTIVTLPGVHATQKMAFVKLLNDERTAQGLAVLSEAEELAVFDRAVDLVMEGSTVYIRPNPDDMPLAFLADELLQQIVPKPQIQFLYTLNPAVHAAIQRRGECWRISPLPRTAGEMKEMIRRAKVRITGLDLYYYSMVTGTRYLTLQQFLRLGALPPDEIARHLLEIRTFAGRSNRFGNREVAFFGTGSRFGLSDFTAYDLDPGDRARLLAAYEALRAGFQAAVPPDLREDNADSLEWRTRMFAALLGLEKDTATEEALLGLGSEFFLQVEWLPGARLENGELIFDSVFNDLDRQPAGSPLQTRCDEKVRGFIINFIREYDDVLSVNIGRVATSLSRRVPGTGRREVYLAQLQRRRQDAPQRRILRMQKWGIAQHLDDGKDLLQAIMQAEEYTDYILDRRLGCRQLGMNVPLQIASHKITERYEGTNAQYHGQMIWSAYFERDYIPGAATDKIPASRFRDIEFALRFAALLGRAAASNLIVGRTDLENAILFDDGDEVLVTDSRGQPAEIIVSDHTGAFHDYLSPLEALADPYARPLLRRLGFVSCPDRFAHEFLAALAARFRDIQGEYRSRRAAFDTLFRHCRRDEKGSFAFRWEKVLQRLDTSDPDALVSRIAGHVPV